MDARINIIADSRQVRTATQDLERLERQGKTTTAVTNQLRTAFAALGGALAVRELKSLADTYTNIQNRIRVVTGETEQLVLVQQQLLDIANRSRADFEGTAIIYSRLGQATAELGVSQERLLGIVETINKSLAVSGATAEEAAGALRQLSQGIASGTLRGEEFNSVAEQAPEILRAVAKETGLAFGALREFAAEGGITSELLIRALENYRDTVERVFQNTNRTFAQSFQEARNNAIQFVGGLDAVQDASRTAGEALVALSENLDVVVDVATALVALYGARVVGAIGAAIAAKVADTAATIRQTQATAAASAAELSYLQTVQRSLVAQLQSSTVTAQQTRLRQQLAANTVALTAAQRGAATSMTAMGLAARGAAGAMALLGGPAGVVLLAAGAFAYFVSQQEDVEKQVKKSTEEMRNFVDTIDSLNQKQARSQEIKFAEELGRLIDESQRLSKALDEARKKRDSFSSGGVGAGYGAGEFVKSSVEIGKLTDELAKNKKEQELLEAVIARLAARQLEAAQAAREQAEAAQRQADSNALQKINQGLADQIYELENGKAAYELYRAAREANIALDSPEAQGIAKLIEYRDELIAKKREEIELERERERLGGAVTSMVNDLSVGDDPAAQAEDAYFARLSVIDNALAIEAITQEEHRQAELLAEQEYQDELTRISAEAERIRTQQAEQEAQQRRAATESLLTGLGDVFGNFAEIARQGGEESFGTYKALASAQAAMSAAVAINRALAEGGPFLGPALAVSIAALTGAQIAAIHKQEYNPRAVGGQVLEGNQYLVGERGPELITMGANGNVTPYNQLMREARQGQQAPQQNVRVIVENYGSERATTSESVVNDERIIRVVVGNINARREIHNAITRTTSASNKVGV